VSYFDLVSEAVGATSTVANRHSTEADQFHWHWQSHCLQ
jgi:hypothetical protein